MCLMISHKKGNIMKICVIVILFSLLSQGCTNEPTIPLKLHSPSKVIVEGTVFYFVGGGTAEIQFPSGYQLINSKWLPPSTWSDTGFSIYLSGSIGSSFLNKHARAFGRLDSIPVYYSLKNSITGYLREIYVDSLQVIN